MHFRVASRGSPLTLASQQVGHVLIIPIKSLKFFLAPSVSQFSKVFCFGGFIVTTFIMLILIEN